MQGRLTALMMMATTLAGCDAYVTVEGTIEPRLFARSQCEFFMQSPTWRSLSRDIRESDFFEGLPASPFGEDLYTVRVDCKAHDGTLLASRQEIVTLGSDASTLYMGLISTERQKAPDYEPEWIAKAPSPDVALDVETPPPSDPTCPRRESPSAYPQAFAAIKQRLAEDGQRSASMKRLHRLASRNGWLLIEAEYARLGPMSFLLEPGSQGYSVKSYFVGITPKDQRYALIHALFLREAPQVPPDLLACLQD